MKKKLLFFTYFCEYNGVEKSILNLLKNLNPADFEIDLIVLGSNETLMSKVPKHVNVIQLPLSDYMRDVVVLHPRAMISKLRSQKKYFSILRYIFSTAWHCLLHGFNRHAVCRSAAKKYKSNKKYDAAFDFYGHNLFGTYFISQKVIADKKATWLHHPAFIDEKLLQFENIFDSYNKVYSVSYECAEKFKKIFPNFDNRIEIFRNLLDTSDIIKKGEEPIPFRKDTFFISTAGRLHPIKGYDIAIKASLLLKNKGYKFKWFFIGDGDEKESLKKCVLENNLEEYIVFTGFCENPYKYIAKSDIYVQPSREEGYCTTMLEARILQIPVIASDIPSSREQITDSVNGLLFKTNDYKALCDKLEMLITNKALVAEIHKNETEDLSYTSEILKIYHLLNDK